MCYDPDGDGWENDDHYVLVGGLLMGVAAVLVVALLVWVTR